MKKLKQRLLSAVLTLAMLATSPLAMVRAAAEDTGKYVSEVFIAYGKTEEDARNWLVSHGWEPVVGDLNAGKLSYWDKNDKVAAVMGIKRTNDASDAVTDMAVMNMKGGYSFSDYDQLVAEKKTDIDAFVDAFLPVIEEYRENYNGRGSAGGKARADLAYELLNKFYDGDPTDENAKNDTGMPLGDLFLKATVREFGEDKYEKLSANEKAQYGDLQQIILESTGPAVLAVEQALAMASDSSGDTWLERLSEISGVSLSGVVGDYVPSAAGQKLSPSAAESLLQSEFGDAAAKLAADYDAVQQDLIWYQAFMENNDLNQQDGESDGDYKNRYNAFFEALKAQDEDYYSDTIKHYYNAMVLYSIAYSTEYEGEWGETLGDFLNPEDGENYGADPDNFLPIAAVLSEGQRAGLEFLTLATLLRVGLDSPEGIEDALPDVEKLLNEAEAVSIYAGMNRAIFRGGAALTSQALMQKNRGRDWYEDAMDPLGTANILIMSTATLGAAVIVTGVVVAVKFSVNKGALALGTNVFEYYDTIGEYEADLEATMDVMKSSNTKAAGRAQKYYNEYVGEVGTVKDTTRLSKIGKKMAGIGGAIMLAAACFEAYQMYQFYQRKFTRIPMMIVDEADIVTYMTDENGNPILDANGKQKKNIEFDQFAYYDVVKCNRQEVGEIGDWQNGVSDYKDKGCGDAADLNCDCGKQWLAMYTIKSPAKGNPILADSLTYQTGNANMPKNCTKQLHLFSYAFAMNIADEAYCFNNDKGGIYLF